MTGCPRVLRPAARVAGLILCLAATAGIARAQAVSQRGFIEVRGVFYPQQAPHDDRQAVADLLARYEVSGSPTPWMMLAAGVDARADSQGQVIRPARLSWDDRTALRPAVAVRRLSALVTRGGLTVEVGKQFVRWGKTDVLTPTDRFAPRDFMEVVTNDLLPVFAARATYERGGRTLDLAWVPRSTPSRLPMSGRRWSVAETRAPAIPGAPAVPAVDGGADYPGGPQFGVRYSHVASGFEYALSYFDGYNHLPGFELRLRPAAVEIMRVFPRIRSYGADLAWPTRWCTFKGEVAFFDSADVRADRYTQFVLQLERQSGEWSFVAGYAGEAVATRRAVVAFAPDRGLTKSLLGRVSYTLDANRSVTVEGAVRQNGGGAWIKAEYSQAVGSHWRVTAGTNLIRGDETDFLGQFRRNSHLGATLRCSF